MTRDFFDFQVVHLSSTTNQLPRMTDASLQKELTTRMNKTVEQFKNAIKEHKSGQELLAFRMSENRPRMINTVVILPYTSPPGTQKISKKDADVIRATYELRLLYLQAGVLSISRLVCF